MQPLFCNLVKVENTVIIHYITIQFNIILVYSILILPEFDLLYELILLYPSKAVLVNCLISQNFYPLHCAGISSFLKF